LKSIKSWLSGLILTVLGWKVKTAFPLDTPKAIYVVAPHTSMWDFPYGILARNYIKVPIGFVIKSELMKGPLGWLLNWMGAYPVDRSKTNNFVEGVANVIKAADNIHICITPEGRRGPIKKMKRGFWFMATQAEVPLVLVTFDFGNKVLDFSDLYWCTEIEKDMEYIWNHYKGVKGHTPENGILTSYVKSKEPVKTNQDIKP